MPADSQLAPITVATPGASYPILIEGGILTRAGEQLDPVIRGRRVFVLSDNTVWRFWGKQFLRALAPLRPPVILIPPGERYKRLATVEKITQALSEYGAERSSVLLVLGGGVTGDMGGFAASIFLRGISYVQIPTTLLAQVDSAIGGKTGVNLIAGKNLAGTFYQPKMVLSDPRVLRTLPPRELRAGLFEAIKCGIIGDPQLFDFLESKRDAVLSAQPSALERVIRHSSSLKARVVSADEKEGGLRRVLNFGHTVGHALEAATGYRHFLHGEAVAWGMLAVNRLAVEQGFLSEEDARRMERLICLYGPLPPLNNIEPSTVFSHMTADKKVRDGQIHFVLARKIGQVEVASGIARTKVIAVLKHLMKHDPFRAKRPGAKARAKK